MATVTKLFCLIVAAGALALFFTGCHTVQGAGEDIQKGGEKIEQIAE